MNLIDTHAHIYVDAFDEDIDEVILRAKNNGISKILLPNIDEPTVDRLVQLWQKDTAFFYPMMGIHPCSIKKDFETQLDLIFSLFEQHPFIAVGEIGLDYYWSKDLVEAQKQAFIQQIRFAKKKNLPIAVHCRDAYDDILHILEQEQDGNLRGVLHCFTGNVDQAKRLQKIGFKMGLGGVLTFKNAGLDKVVAEFPLDNFILETDAPYLTPHPYRGKRNESGYVKLVAEKLATIYNVSVEEVGALTSKKAWELFALNSPKQNNLKT
jgi:TatD DNase family protein